VQTRGRSADVSFLQHGFEQNQQVQIDASEISFIQHMAEIVSLDSA